MRLTHRGIQVVCESPDLRIEYPATAFAADPRVAGFDWTRVMG